MGRIVHFEILTEDINRAIKFYKDVFGWKIDKWGDQEYYLITTGPDTTPGINGGMMPRSERFNDKSGFQAFLCTVEVKDGLDKYIEKIKQAGGKQYSDKTTIPDMGTFAYFEDTEGNIFGVMETETKN